MWPLRLLATAPTLRAAPLSPSQCATRRTRPAAMQSLLGPTSAHPRCPDAALWRSMLSGKQANTKTVDRHRVRILHDAPLGGVGPVVYCERFVPARVASGDSHGAGRQGCLATSAPRTTGRCSTRKSAQCRQMSPSVREASSLWQARTPGLSRRSPLPSSCRFQPRPEILGRHDSAVRIHASRACSNRPRTSCAKHPPAPAQGAGVRPHRLSPSSAITDPPLPSSSRRHAPFEDAGRPSRDGARVRERLRRFASRDRLYAASHRTAVAEVGLRSLYLIPAWGRLLLECMPLATRVPTHAHTQRCTVFSCSPLGLRWPTLTRIPAPASAVAAAVTVPMHEVDAHNVVPVWAARWAAEYSLPLCTAQHGSNTICAIERQRPPRVRSTNDSTPDYRQVAPLPCGISYSAGASRSLGGQAGARR